MEGVLLLLHVGEELIHKLIHSTLYHHYIIKRVLKKILLLSTLGCLKEQQFLKFWLTLINFFEIYFLLKNNAKCRTIIYLNIKYGEGKSPNLVNIFRTKISSDVINKKNLVAPEFIECLSNLKIRFFWDTLINMRPQSKNKLTIFKINFRNL